MGSLDKACISGFLCRLCSEMHRTVIHIYGDEGLKLGLVDKINGYLPITISPTDPLPKTICSTCLRRVEQHYDLLLRLKQFRNNHGDVAMKNIPNKIDSPLATLCRVHASSLLDDIMHTSDLSDSSVENDDDDEDDDDDDADDDDDDDDEEEEDDDDDIAHLDENFFIDAATRQLHSDGEQILYIDVEQILN